ASGNEIADKFVLDSVVLVANSRKIGVEPVHAHVFYFEMHMPLGGDARVVQIFQNLVLRVNRDPSSASEFFKVDAVPAAVEAQLDSVMNQALFLQALADAHLCQEIDRALLQHARAHALLYILPAAVLHHDRFDSLEIEEV